MNEQRRVQRIEGSGIPEKGPVTLTDLAHYAAWPQRLRNNIGGRHVQTDDVSAQNQVIPVIEHLVAEVRRLQRENLKLQGERDYLFYGTAKNRKIVGPGRKLGSSP